jgi:hypothetical protein
MIFVHRQAAITKVAKFRGWMADSPPLRGVSSAACAAGAEIVDLLSGAHPNPPHLARPAASQSGVVGGFAVAKRTSGSTTRETVPRSGGFAR